MLGNERLKSLVRKDVLSGNLSHAYLLTGEKGSGKKSLARQMCLYAFCQRPGNGEPCGTCPACRKVLSGNHPDILPVLHEKPEIIKVDEIREQLLDTVTVKPYEGKRKFYIVDEAEKMAPQAQNALLKSLEEPPQYVTILLLAADEKALLDTVRSRCVKLRMEPVPDAEILSFLETEYGVPKEKAEICTAFAKGNPGLAVTLCSDEAFGNLYKNTVNLCRNVRSMDAGAIFEAAKSLAEDSASLKDFFALLSLWYRDVLMVKLSGAATGLTFRDEKGALQKESSYVSAEGVSLLLSEIGLAGKRITANVNKELTIELLLLKMKETR